MVKIGDTPPVFPLHPKKDVRKPSKKGAFKATVSGIDSSTPKASVGETAATSPLSPLSSLMQVQEVGERETPEDFFYQRGETLLCHLELLRHGFLRGALSKQDLETIKADLSTQQQNLFLPDPLREVLEEIEQRVHIEMIKIEMSQTESDSRS